MCARVDLDGVCNAGPCCWESHYDVTLPPAQQVLLVTRPRFIQSIFWAMNCKSSVRCSKAFCPRVAKCLRSGSLPSLAQKMRRAPTWMRLPAVCALPPCQMRSSDNAWTGRRAPHEARRRGVELGRDALWSHPLKPERGGPPSRPSAPKRMHTLSNVCIEDMESSFRVATRWVCLRLDVSERYQW